MHSPKFSEEFVDEKADAGLALLTNGYIRIYNDPKPAHVDDAITSQTLLAELRWNAVAAFQAAAGGVAVANAITKDDSANAEGTATWFRALKADGVSPIFDGTVGVGTFDLSINTIDIEDGAEVRADSFNYVESEG